MAYVTPSGKEVPDVDRLISALGLDQQTLADFRRHYNSKFSEYGNEVYSRIESRVTHWLNFLDQGWFTRRLDRYLGLAGEFDVIVDLGFSAPYAYAVQRLVSSRSRYVYADKEASAYWFYSELVRQRGLMRRRKLDTVIHLDIEDGIDQERLLRIVRELRPKSILIAAIEVIEHLQRDKRAWQLISKLESTRGVTTSQVYVTIPVGNHIPSHTLEFRTPGQAMKYLESHIHVQWSNELEACEDFVGRPFLEACVDLFGDCGHTKRQYIL